MLKETTIGGVDVKCYDDDGKDDKERTFWGGWIYDSNVGSEGTRAVLPCIWYHHPKNKNVQIGRFQEYI